MVEGKGGGRQASMNHDSKGLKIGDILIDIDHGQNQARGSMIRKPWNCMPKAALIPSMTVWSLKIREWIQYMLDIAFIGKFVGMQPSEKALFGWINSTWKPKGHYDLHLGSKGFFTISFISLEDRNWVFDGGPYFYYSIGLFLRPWKEKFCTEKEDMRITPVWIMLYSLPSEYWDP